MDNKNGDLSIFSDPRRLLMCVRSMCVSTATPAAVRRLSGTITTNYKTLLTFYYRFSQLHDIVRNTAPSLLLFCEETFTRSPSSSVHTNTVTGGGNSFSALNPSRGTLSRSKPVIGHVTNWRLQDVFLTLVGKLEYPEKRQTPHKLRSLLLE